MSAASGPALTVDSLVAARDTKRQRDHEASEQLHRRTEEELEAFRKRLDTFQMTEDVIKSGHDRLRRAFEAGNSELMISAFPSSFCSVGGRAIINAGAPPINRPTKEELVALDVALLTDMTDRPLSWSSARTVRGASIELSAGPWRLR